MIIVYRADANPAEPESGGTLVIGETTDLNLAFDNNEIMARNNGATSTLYLNNDGGDVVVGGAIDIGYELVIVHLEDEDSATAWCSAGKRIIGQDQIGFLKALDFVSNVRCQFEL